ncbi:hypothetical protein CDAR_95081 [Caerostris darwini]|uniref:Uncharacterized protein n=1 Tax=Caerostris darwini TaxID=1538125 RepID=A0AAV4PLI9_9ARAC|nr:hypothetical protein CDAR_95081 [Caerostris darwini]
MSCKREEKKEHFPAMIRNVPLGTLPQTTSGQHTPRRASEGRSAQKFLKDTSLSQSILGDILRVHAKPLRDLDLKVNREDPVLGTSGPGSSPKMLCASTPLPTQKPLNDVIHTPARGSASRQRELLAGFSPPPPNDQ